jgi:hypothetical protein
VSETIRFEPSIAVREVSDLAPTLTGAPDGIEWVQVLGRSPSRLPVAV